MIYGDTSIIKSDFYQNLFELKNEQKLITKEIVLKDTNNNTLFQ